MTQNELNHEFVVPETPAPVAPILGTSACSEDVDPVAIAIVKSTDRMPTTAIRG